MIEVASMKESVDTQNIGEEKPDVVNKPNHYRQGTFEVIDEMIMAFGPQRTYDFCILNAWKYRSRAPYKGTPVQDMEKADRYMQMAYQIAESNGMIGGCCHGYPIGNLIKGAEDGQFN